MKNILIALAIIVLAGCTHTPNSSNTTTNAGAPTEESSRTPANCGGSPDTDMIGGPMVRRWQKSERRPCGPAMPWNVNEECPSNAERGGICNGRPHGSVCFIRPQPWELKKNFQCDAPNGQTPSRDNYQFVVYYCP